MDVMGRCAIDCFGQGEDCGARCVEDTVGVTAPCADCFGSMLTCTLTHCAFQCAGGDADACAACQADNCLAAFEGCAGISPP